MKNQFGQNTNENISKISVLEVYERVGQKSLIKNGWFFGRNDDT